MAKEPRMGSDRFQKRDPLDWIGKTDDEETKQTTSGQSPQSNLPTGQPRTLL